LQVNSSAYSLTLKSTTNASSKTFTFPNSSPNFLCSG
jgi:hypothetical protein